MPRGILVFLVSMLFLVPAAGAEEAAPATAPVVELVAKSDTPARVEAPEGWNAENWVCPNPKCRELMSRRYLTTEPCPECGTQTRPDGICDGCARKKCVCRFCRRVFPAVVFHPCRFREGNRLFFELHFHKPEKPLKLFAAGSAHAWRLVFAPKDGGAPRVAVYTPPFPIPEGEHLVLEDAPVTRGVTMDINMHWEFRDARDDVANDERITPAKILPPGRYTVTATYEHPAGHPQDEVCPYWHGTVTSSAVEIEIVPKVP